MSLNSSTSRSAWQALAVLSVATALAAALPAQAEDSRLGEAIQLAQAEIEPLGDERLDLLRPEELDVIRPLNLPFVDYKLRDIGTIFPFCRLHEAQINTITFQVDIASSSGDCIPGPVRILAEVTYSDGLTETLTQDVRGICGFLLHEPTGTYAATAPLRLHPAEAFSVAHYPVSIIGFVDPADAIEERNETNNSFSVNIAAYRRDNCV